MTTQDHDLGEQVRQRIDRQFSSASREGQPSAPKPINISDEERWVSTAAGGALVLLGLSRMSFKGLIVAGLGAGLVNRGITGHCHVSAALGQHRESERPAPEKFEEKGVHVEQSYTINRPAAELYAFWRNFENLPRFMQHLKSVKNLEDGKSQWVVEGPGGKLLQWTAEITQDTPDKSIAWQSLGGADIDNSGSIEFVEQTEGYGTQVKVALDYIPPAGKVGAVVAYLFGKSGQQEVQEDLRRFKSLMEAGEIPTIDGQPRGVAHPPIDASHA